MEGRRAARTFIGPGHGVSSGLSQSNQCSHRSVSFCIISPRFASCGSWSTRPSICLIFAHAASDIQSDRGPMLLVSGAMESPRRSSRFMASNDSAPSRTRICNDERDAKA